MGAADLVLDLLGRVSLSRVNDDVSTVFLSGLQLIVIDVNCDDVSLEDILGPLNTEVTKATSTINGNPLTRTNLAGLDGLVGGNSGTGY